MPPTGAWGVPAGYAVPPPPPEAVLGSSGGPNPLLAFFLGLIPGVGAMYNGQVAKGLVHLIVFAILVSISNTIDIFGIFVAGWIFFMAFEAYHTAKARRDGLPLPNAFGWNDISERVGLGKNWPFSPGAPVAGASAPPMASAPGWTGAAQGAAVPPAGATPPAGWDYAGTYPAGGGQGVAPNWAGYVPPTTFAGGADPAAGMGATGGAVPPGHGMPYSPVNAGVPYAPVPPVSPVDGTATASRLPVGALWLIGLGVLFLLGQWTPLLQLSRVWIPSVLLVGIAGLLFARRMEWTGSGTWQRTAGLPPGLRAATAVRVPGILVAIAILNGLHEAKLARWDRSWPWLLIAVGLLLLVERLALRQAANLQAVNLQAVNFQAAGDPVTGGTPRNGGL